MSKRQYYKSNNKKNYQSYHNNGYNNNYYQSSDYANNRRNNSNYQSQSVYEPPQEVPSNFLSSIQLPEEKYLVYPGEIYSFDDKIYENSVFKIKNGNLLTKKPGFLLKSENDNKSSITIGRIYTPKEGDLVIGTVTQKFTDFYKIDISTYSNAVLFKQNTEGNKNSKLNADIGDLILCKVLSVNANDVPSLSTVKIKDRSTLNVFCDIELGKLKGGMVYDLPITQLRFFNKGNPTIRKIKENRQCGIAIANNGKIYISTKENDFNVIPLIYEIICDSAKLENKNMSVEEITNRFNAFSVNS